MVKPQIKNDDSVLLGERIPIGFNTAHEGPLLSLNQEAIAEREQKYKSDLIVKFYEEYKVLEPELSRVPLKEWKELFERYQAGTICLACFRKGYDWKNTIRDPVTREIICGTCGEVLKSPTG